MSEFTYHPIHAPRGTALTCKGWHQEAALRMLCNNLDPEVAERPEQLIVYGGTGRAARNWECFEAIVRTLKELADDERIPHVAPLPARSHRQLEPRAPLGDQALL